MRVARPSTLGARNNLNLHSKFDILISHNKCIYFLFCVLSSIQFCAIKLLLSVVVLKVTSSYKVFFTKSHAHEMF